MINQDKCYSFVCSPYDIFEDVCKSSFRMFVCIETNKILYVPGDQEHIFFMNK